MKGWRRRLGLICFAIALPEAAARAQADPPVPTAESLAVKIRERLAVCDSQVTEMCFVSTVYERELNDDGTVKSEKISRAHNYVRDKDARVILGSMTEDGKSVTEKKLRDEQAKIDKQRRERLEKKAKGNEKDKDDDESEQSISILEPFMAKHAADYRFTAVAPDSAGGLDCWRITVEPAREDEGLVKGSAWVTRETLLPVIEEYQPAKMPTAVSEFSFRMEYTPCSDRCGFPRHFTLEGKGRALLVIKFHFGVEMFLDSVQVNPGLPDSLFASPANE